MKDRSMTESHISTLTDPKSSADSAARADRELNAAIISADISASYEEFMPRSRQSVCGHSAFAR